MKHTEFSWQGTQGGKIYAQSWQPEADVRGIIALVHGLGEHSDRYAHVAETFTGAGLATVAIDLPGHGKSQGTRGHTTYVNVADEIGTLLAECGRRFPGKPRFLYGHSLGGALALYYLLKRQPTVQGAIITSPSIAPGMPVTGSKLFAARVFSRLMPAFTMNNGLSLENLSHDAKVIQAYKEDPLVHPKISAKLGWDMIQEGAWMLEHAADIGVPLLLMQGTEDKLVSVEATRAFAKKVKPALLTYKEWDGLYHETHNELQKQQVIAFTVGWINQQMGTR